MQSWFSRFGMLGLVLASFGCSGACGGSQASQASAQAAAAQSQAASKDPSCEVCRTRLCSNAEGSAEGVNLYAGCFEKPDPKLVPSPDGDFAAQCRAVVECAFAHDCAYDPSLGPAHCYCGSRSVDECLSQGPASDAPCVNEWTAATRGKTHAEVLERMSLIEYPSGWAFNLLECDRDRCGKKSVVGHCTP